MTEGLLLFAVGVLAGAVASIAGFGVGSLVTPFLAVGTGMRLAVTLVAIPHAIATAVRLWALRDAVDRAVLLSFGIASAVGGFAGALLQASLSSSALTFVLGALLLIAGLLELTGLGRRLSFPGGWATVAGVASGAFGGLVGNQGGIRSAALLRFDLSPRALVATATASAILVDAARVPVYLVTSGEEIAAHWQTVALLAVAVVTGTLAGAPILRRLPHAVFRRTLAALLLLLGSALLLGLGS